MGNLFGDDYGEEDEPPAAQAAVAQPVELFEEEEEDIDMGDLFGDDADY